MTNVPFSQTERIFSLSGFIFRVLPVVVSITTAMSAVLWLLTDWKQNDIGFVGIFVVPLVVVCVPQLLRYMSAWSAHGEFKEKYAGAYENLVENGNIKLGIWHILMVRSPECYADLLIDLSHS